MKELTKDFTDQLYTDFESNAKYRAVENAATTNGLLKAVTSRVARGLYEPTFSIDLTKDAVANQKASGRCWMFAAMNTFRHKVIKAYSLDDHFEFSQAYPFFWDKYEKANWFFTQLIAHPDMDDRRLKFLLATPQQDGGQWDMITAIFTKYGLVPKDVYKESAASENSHELNQYLNKLLRQGAEKLQAASDKEATKQALLKDVFNLLAASLGLPPKTFEWSYRDKKGENFTRFSGTPQDFFKTFVATDLDNYVSVINAPTADKPFNKSYTVEFLGNVVGDKGVKHLNLPMTRFKELAVKQLQSGETVWFGCDVSQESDRSGRLILDAFDFPAALDFGFTQTKASRLDYGESLMTHAMVLAGVDLDAAGQPRKWKVENSWGDENGVKGYYVASDAWMDEYTYQIVVRKDLLTPDELAAYEAEPQQLLPWDPMGALA
ncbi:MAG: aminopeptidase [Streptococcaceae bacterium]|nr:aminopeptidase [Streptococcaceae bacterium]